MQRLRHVLIRQFAQVFGGDGIDDADRIALDVDGLLLAGPDAGDDDLVHRRCILGTGVIRRRVLRHDDSG
ncbi:hypothetical protein D3C85_1758660 [compost metagenome]